MSRGGCHDDREAKAPPATCRARSRSTWGRSAHEAAQKPRSRLAKTIRRERPARRLRTITRNGRQRRTFQASVGENPLGLDIFPPQTAEISALSMKANWRGDLTPVIPTHWPSGRSLATRLAAWARAQGRCARGGAHPVAQVQHTGPLGGRSFLASVASDSAPRSTARARCRKCPREDHGGAFTPSTQRSRGRAGCAERCLSGSGTAS